MGKTKNDHATNMLLGQYINEFGKRELRICGKTIICGICDAIIGSETHPPRKSQVRQHVMCAAHLTKKNNALQLPLTFEIESSNQKRFNDDLAKMFIDCNIPVHKLNHNGFKLFMQKYTKFKVPDESSLRKTYFPKLHSETLNMLREELRDDFLWIAIDATTVKQRRSVIAMIVCALRKDAKPRLLAIEYLTQVNSSTISQFVINSLHVLYGDHILYDNVLLFVTDAEPCMKAAANSLHTFFPRMVYITCVVHAFHRVAEIIRAKFKKVNRIITSVKAIYTKSPLRVQHFKNKLPGINLPPKVCTVRWGTWLNAAFYYAEHFESIKMVIDDLNSGDAASIGEAQELFSQSNIRSDLVFISSNFRFITKAIKDLEAKDLLLSQSMEIVKNFTLEIEALPSTAKFVKDKHDSVFDANSGLRILSDICNIIDGSETGSDEICSKYPRTVLSSFKHSVLTTVEVERFFSIFKHVLSDQRQHFSFDNLKSYLFSTYNTNT